jgi:hypothetical protein
MHRSLLTCPLITRYKAVNFRKGLPVSGRSQTSAGGSAHIGCGGCKLFLGAWGTCVTLSRRKPFSLVPRDYGYNTSWAFLKIAERATKSTAGD